MAMTDVHGCFFASARAEAKLASCECLHTPFSTAAAYQLKNVASIGYRRRMTTRVRIGSAAYLSFFVYTRIYIYIYICIYTYIYVYIYGEEKVIIH